jgi:succinyl-CoA synthetase beta subunit
VLNSIPPLGYAFTPTEAAAAFKKLSFPKVIKSQVYVGGLGQGIWVEDRFKSGVHVIASANETAELTKQFLGRHLHTKQTPTSSHHHRLRLNQPKVVIQRTSLIWMVLQANRESLKGQMYLWRKCDP